MNGAFTISALDGELFFNFIALSPAHEPTFRYGIDPRKDEGVRFELAARPEPDTDNDLIGKIVDGEGNPVIGARISVLGQTDGSTTRYGSIDGIEQLAVTNQEGEFILGGTSKAYRYHLYVTARALAPGLFNDLEPGASTDLALIVGVTVNGRLMHGDEPLSGTPVGFMPIWTPEYHHGEEQLTATDEGGYFTFLNVVPGRELSVYAKREGLMELDLATSPRKVRTLASGTELDIGVFQATQAITISGYVELSDGGRLPPKRSLILSPDTEWDGQYIELDDEGHFEFRGLWPGEYRLSSRVTGYLFTDDNWSVSPFGHDYLEGQIRESRDDLVLLMGPGTWNPNERPENPIAQRFFERRSGPLRGAE